MKEKEQLEAQLESAMDRWVYLNEICEQIQQQKAGKYFLGNYGSW